MKKAFYFFSMLIILTSCNLFNSKSKNNTKPSDIWVSAYFDSWNNYVLPTGNWGNLPTNGIDWEAFTHMIYFSLAARSDGTIAPAIADYQNISPDRLNSIIPAAHAHDVPILICIGGWGNYDGFSAAIAPGSRDNLVKNLVNVMDTWKFDGIDIDMEPINGPDVQNYIDFIHALRSAMNGHKTPLLNRPLLTAAVKWQPAMFAQIQDDFDQINIMTYDMSGAWPGWVSWYNSPVYSAGITFPTIQKLVPSADQNVQNWIKAGIMPKKLGIGIDFYGYVWSGGDGTPTGGVSAPNQSWTTAPSVQDNVPYYTIMDKYFNSTHYHWDNKADAAWLGIDDTGSANDKFISYDDEKAIDAKIKYVRENGLGGTIIYDISGGYRSDQPAGQRDKLLQAVKYALNNIGN